MSVDEQMREEEHFRQVERAMLYADDAARKVTEIAAAIRKDGAPEYLVAALEAAGDAIRADHKRLMQSVYWRAPDSPQAQLSIESDQEPLAS